MSHNVLGDIHPSLRASFFLLKYSPCKRRISSTQCDCAVTGLLLCFKAQCMQIKVALEWVQQKRYRKSLFVTWRKGCTFSTSFFEPLNNALDALDTINTPDRSVVLVAVKPTWNTIRLLYIYWLCTRRKGSAAAAIDPQHDRDKELRYVTPLKLHPSKKETLWSDKARTILSERKTLFLLFLSQGATKQHFTSTTSFILSLFRSPTMLDAVTRPAKALVYGTALFRYTHSPLTLAISLNSSPTLISKTTTLRTSREETVLPLLHSCHLMRQLAPLRPLCQQTLLTKNNNNAYTYERTQRTVTIKTGREAEWTKQPEPENWSTFFFNSFAGDIVSALCSMSSRSFLCSWCLSRNVCSSRWTPVWPVRCGRLCR